MQPARRAVVVLNEMECRSGPQASPDAPTCSSAYLGQGPGVRATFGALFLLSLLSFAHHDAARIRICQLSLKVRITDTKVENRTQPAKLRARKSRIGVSSLHLKMC